MSQHNQFSRRKTPEGRKEVITITTAYYLQSAVIVASVTSPSLQTRTEEPNLTDVRYLQLRPPGVGVRGSPSTSCQSGNDLRV